VPKHLIDIEIVKNVLKKDKNMTDISKIYLLWCFKYCSLTHLNLNF